jgi:hypothetical protein
MKHSYKWTPSLLSDHYEEAVSTTRRLPSVKVQGYFNAWPGIVHTPQELMLMEARSTKVLPSADAISRLGQALEWMQWLTIKERKLVWARAARVPWKKICGELGYTRMTVWRMWVSALTKISSQLNNKT